MPNHQEREVEYTRNEKGEVEIDGITFKPHNPLREEWEERLKTLLIANTDEDTSLEQIWMIVGEVKSVIKETVSLERKRMAEEVEKIPDIEVTTLKGNQEVKLTLNAKSTSGILSLLTQTK